MRFSPGDARYLVYERGQHPSDGPRRLEVRDLTTGAVTTLPAGYNPRWVDDALIVAESPIGVADFDRHDALFVRYIPANRGQLDANGQGDWAVADIPTGITTVSGAGLPTRIGSGRDPRLSASARIAVRHPATGVLRLDGGPDLGLCEDSRWGSNTLCWWLSGRVWGRSTPEAPTTELTIDRRACAHPCPCWHAQDGRLWVGMVLDAGELVIVEWGHQDGYRVGVSDGSGFDHDLAEAGPGRLRYAYFNALGRPIVTTVDVSGPPQSLAPTQPQPPDPEPPVPEPPDPPEEPTPMPDLKDRATFFAEFRALNDFYAAPEGLQRPGGMLFPVDAGNPVAHVDAEAMAAWGYDLMTGASVESCKARIRQSWEWKDKHAGDPVQPVTFSGPISVSGAGFVVPE